MNPGSPQVIESIGAGERTRTADLLITNELLPKWRSLRASEIRRRDVRALVEGIAERPAPIAANRIRALISKIFNFGISREMVEFNPCSQLEQPASERSRDRVLTDAEICTFWTMLGLVQLTHGRGARPGGDLRLLRATRLAGEC